MYKGLTYVLVALLAQSIFADTVYQTKKDGIVSFSNKKTKGATIIDLSSVPVTVLQNNSKRVQNESSHLDKLTSSYKQHYFPYQHQNTLKGSFPEQLTDNYFDFYGRNHHYDTLMSSTQNGGFYDSSGANNSRLRSNY